MKIHFTPKNYFSKKKMIIALSNFFGTTIECIESRVLHVLIVVSIFLRNGVGIKNLGNLSLKK